VFLSFYECSVCACQLRLQSLWRSVLDNNVIQFSLLKLSKRYPQVLSKSFLDQLSRAIISQDVLMFMEMKIEACRPGEMSPLVCTANSVSTNAYVCVLSAAVTSLSLTALLVLSFCELSRCLHLIRTVCNVCFCALACRHCS